MSRIDTDTWTRSALARAEVLAGAGEGVLATLRAAGREAFGAMNLPGPKSESWKYSRVGPLLEEGLLDRPVADGTTLSPAPLSGVETARLTLVDGVLDPAASADLLPEGVTVRRFSELTGDLAARVATECGRLAPATARPFVALNAALAEDGIVLHVARDRKVALPIELILAQRANAAPCGAHPRVLVLADAGAQLTLVERQVGDALQFTNTVMEVVVQTGARVDHVRLALQTGAARWLTALDVEVHDDGRYALHQALLGAAFRRSEIRLWAAGPGAHIEVGGATLTRDRTHLDTQLCIEHAVPHCSSNQVFRSIAGERSRTILNGRIHIHPDAQKTAAEFNTRNLLLSASAEINAKPELEIYADDVTCAHGATVGQLDEAALFYLRARGIDAQQARTLLAFAFLASVVAAFPVAGLADAVRGELDEAFSAGALELEAGA